MGCHTWVYKKISTLSDDLKRKAVEREINELADSYILVSPKKEFIKWMNEDCRETYTKEMYDKDVQKYKDRIEKLKSEGFDYLVKVVMKDRALVEKIGKEYYWNIDFDYPFRVCGYPEETFTKKDELLEWLKTRKTDVGYYKETGEFVGGYTPELEDRVNKYFDEHGEDNLFFSFG